MHTFRVHHNCKINTVHFEQGKRAPHPRDLRPDGSLRVLRGHRALLDQKQEEVLMWLEDEADDGKPNHPLAHSTGTVDQSKATAKRALALRWK